MKSTVEKRARGVNEDEWVWKTRVMKLRAEL